MSSRILELFLRLLSGETLKIKVVANEYKKNERTIERDMKVIRETLFSKLDNLVLLNSNGKYFLRDNRPSYSQSILVILKVLLESRALNKGELTHTIETLTSSLNDTDRLFIKRAIKNELFYYEHPEMTPNYIKLIWKLEQYIQNQEEVNFYYNNREEMKIEIIYGVPMAVYFDNFYFYISVLVNKRFKIFNINWINNLKSTRKFISYDYSSKFLPGKHRNFSYYFHHYYSIQLSTPKTNQASRRRTKIFPLQLTVLGNFLETYSHQSPDGFSYTLDEEEY